MSLLKRSARLSYILYCEPYFTLNIFIHNINTAKFVLFIKGSFTLFVVVLVVFLIQTLHFWVRPTVLACLVGHRSLCWLAPSECRDSSNLSFCTLKALTCLISVNHSTSSCRQGNGIQIFIPLYLKIQWKCGKDECFYGSNQKDPLEISLGVFWTSSQCPTVKSHQC